MWNSNAFGRGDDVGPRAGSLYRYDLSRLFLLAFLAMISELSRCGGLVFSATGAHTEISIGANEC